MFVNFLKVALAYGNFLQVAKKFKKIKKVTFCKLKESSKIYFMQVAEQLKKVKKVTCCELPESWKS